MDIVLVFMSVQAICQNRVCVSRTTVAATDSPKAAMIIKIHIRLEMTTPQFSGFSNGFCRSAAVNATVIHDIPILLPKESLTR